MVCLKCLLFEETLARVLWACKKITFCFTGAIDVLLGAVVQRLRSGLNLGFLFLLLKIFLWIIFSVMLFLRASNHQLVGKMKLGHETNSHPGHENFLCPRRAWFLLLPS